MSIFSWLREKTDGVAGAAACKAMYRITGCVWQYNPVEGDIGCKHMLASLQDAANGKDWMAQRHELARVVWEVEHHGKIDTGA